MSRRFVCCATEKKYAAKIAESNAIYRKKRQNVQRSHCEARLAAVSELTKGPFLGPMDPLCLSNDSDDPSKPRDQSATLLSAALGRGVCCGAHRTADYAVVLVHWLAVGVCRPAVDHLWGVPHRGPVSGPGQREPDRSSRTSGRKGSLLQGPALPHPAYLCLQHLPCAHIDGDDVAASGRQWAALGLAGAADGGNRALPRHRYQRRTRIGSFGKEARQANRQTCNALVGYGHFSLEHNAGHHRRVATPEDCASARLGESFYAFALREVPGAVWGAIELERQRLKKRGFWHPSNQLLQIWLLSVVLMLPLVVVFGPWMIPLIALHHLVSWLMLSQANYVEHYGLGRGRTAHGHYEPVRPIHSWNANQWFSNALLFNLQRHSDHHAHARRDYQVLRTFDDVPTLPSGYPGSFVLALIPPLWFRAMDYRVKAWADKHGGTINRG